MKICTYKRQTVLGIFNRVGILLDDSSIVDVNLVWKKEFEKEGFYNPLVKALEVAPLSLANIISTYQNGAIDFFKETQDLYFELKKLGELTTSDGGALSFNLAADEAASLTRPLDKINCYRDFYAHEKHVKTGFAKRGEEIPEAWYEMPAYYKGATAGFIGPNDIIPWPSYTDKLDYELEFGLVIGLDGKNIKAKDAKDHVFGYTVFNDISARDIQKKEMSVRLGPAKGKDFCSIMGPVIITADEFTTIDPNLKMTAKINDELWSEGLTSDSNFSWSEMIEHASKDEWLLATDFMGSGTVGTGCGLELDKWIKEGDTIELEIEMIGKLINTVGKKRTQDNL